MIAVSSDAGCRTRHFERWAPAPIAASDDGIPQRYFQRYCSIVKSDAVIT
jgi:hypothetical protein